MYVEVYKWFTDTSGLGLAEQMGLLMNSKAAIKEEDIAEVIETWEERVNRLAGHGVAYRLPGEFKKVALKAMLVGKIKDNYELWEADRLSFEELLKKVKEQARAKKLDRDVQRGKIGVALGTNYGQWEPWRSHPRLEMAKAREAKVKAKEETVVKARAQAIQEEDRHRDPHPKGGCFICQGKHWASECPQNLLKKGLAPKVDQGRHLEAVALCCLRGCKGVTGGRRSVTSAVRQGRTSATPTPTHLKLRRNMGSLSSDGVRERGPC